MRESPNHRHHPTMKSRLHKTFSREEWDLIIKRNDFDNVSKLRLRDSLIHGVPDDLRGEIWAYLTRASQLSLQFSSGVYNRLFESIDPNIANAIERDLHRTFPDHFLFCERGGEGQRALCNILYAYANYDPEVGYCQGMGFIVACLIMQISNEELAFWAFVQVMFEYNWRLMFTNGTPKLINMIKNTEKSIKYRFPEILEHIEENELTLVSCFAQYMVTIFLYDTPLDISVRIMDLFLLEGEKLMHRLLSKMLELKREKILELNSEELYQFLRRRMVKECFEEYHLGTLFTAFRNDQELELNEIEPA
ncbi:unnamed protein product [Blepharisma stoltei]|uniref:Rab-GAP TBC domain-containing protein n=1 Tax=Blepharisma stoltei TaxID=1481888 RepID=A0AAU9IV74_9CILI|nr:unnamed protein product [Blepharisma stoltei]